MHLYKNKQWLKQISKYTHIKNRSIRFLSFSRSLSEKIKKLQEALNDRQLAFNALSAKNALLEADGPVVNQQHNDDVNQIKKLQLEKDQLLIHLRQEHQQEKDVI